MLASNFCRAISFVAENRAFASWLVVIFVHPGDPGSGDAKAGETVATSTTTKAGALPVVSKLVRGGPVTGGASSGAQAKRTSRSTMCVSCSTRSKFHRLATGRLLYVLVYSLQLAACAYHLDECAHRQPPPLRPLLA